MKRIVLAAALLLISGPAFADSDIYTDMTGQNRGDDALAASSKLCAQKWGAPQNGEETGPGFKQCMVVQGWLFQETQVTDADAAADAQAAEEAQDEANDEAQQEEEEEVDEEQRNDEFNQQMMLQEQQEEQTQEMVNEVNALAQEEFQQAEQQAIDEENAANAMSQPQN